MANRYRNLIYSTAEYTHSYGAFRGIELSSGSPTSPDKRLAYSQNMFKDYDGEGADALVSVPGYRCFAHYGEKINAIYYQRAVLGGEDHLIVHVGGQLMRHPVSDIHKKGAIGTKIATLEDVRSFGFEWGKFFYVMDTESIIRIDEDGNAMTVGNSGAYPYVPTTFVSGVPYEARNLLLREFKEEYFIEEPRDYLYSSDGLTFTVTDPYQRFCEVSGCPKDVEQVYVPAYVTIANVSYKVTAISDYAFRSATGLSAVYIPSGVKEIGQGAFSECTALTTVVLGDTVTHIGKNAFSGCTGLTTVYLGAAIESVGVESFSGCTSLATVNYALGEEELERIEGIDDLEGKTVAYNTVYEGVKLYLPFHDKVEGIKSVRVDGVSVEYDAAEKGTVFTGVMLDFDSLEKASGIKIIIHGSLTPLGEEWAADMTVLNKETPYQAIIGCRIAEAFDGRIFFSGNPSFPNTVFYTERQKPGEDGALYIGRYNYFNDGVGAHPVKSILAVRDMLAVFKEGDDGSGSIFYHRAESTDHDTIDTIYPVAYVHSGVCATGGAFNFLDDPVFLSKDGVMSLDRQDISSQRNIDCRSHNINYCLHKEDLSKASLGEWLGYLFIGIGGKIYLADSRATFTHPSGSIEYEWFLITDVGGYSGDNTVYRYSSDTHGSYISHPTKVGSAVDYERVFSESDDEGEIRCYVIEDGVKYGVLPTEERSGGDFFPATTFLSHKKLLLFGTEDGHLCLFNNDLIGVAPESIKETPGFDENEYLAFMGDKLHPYYYSFSDHAPKYVLSTAMDNCGVPHLTKSTVKKSLVIKASSAKDRSIVCEIATDMREPISIGSFPKVSRDFNEIDFSSSLFDFSPYSSSVLPEKEKGWIEKQISLTSESFASPISVYAISYRYVIKGKIKNNV